MMNSNLVGRNITGYRYYKINNNPIPIIYFYLIKKYINNERTHDVLANLTLEVETHQNILVKMRLRNHNFLSETVKNYAT